MSVGYKGLEFATRLEARWAAFFDLAGWTWRRNPAPVGNWRPDFRVSIPCNHSECGNDHTLLLSVLPVESLASIAGHPALVHIYSVRGENNEWMADAGAVFGNNPQATTWQMSHGAGGGVFDVPFWVNDADRLWAETAASVA